MRKIPLWLVLFPLLSSPIDSQGGETVPDFAFSFGKCPSSVSGPPGSAVEMQLDLNLTTTSNPDPEWGGASGWALSVAAEGASIVEITTRSTVAAAIDDEPPGLRDRGWTYSELTHEGSGDCEGLHGAMSGVVLSFFEHVTLPPEGTETVARIQVQVRMPEVDGEERSVRIAFVDGCRGSGCCVTNAATWQEGMPIAPRLGSCRFVARAIEPLFRRGDVNDDGRVDVSDAIALLACKFLSDPCPGCRDALDANDDGRDDISDGVTILAFLFVGAAPPATPGPVDCGADPTPDTLATCLQRVCES